MSRNSPEGEAAREAAILARWERQGPIKGRLREAAIALLYAAACAVVMLTSSTLGSVYTGTGAWQSGADAPTIARVGSCEELGPVSKAGVGFWAVCVADVTHASGRVERIVADAGLFEADEAGRGVSIVEACDEAGESCTYGRESNRFLAILDTLRGMVGFAVSFGLILATAIGMCKAVLGIPGWFRFAEKLPVSGSPPPAGTSAPGR